MITAAETAKMVATLTASLPDTVYLSRSTTAADGIGGVTDSWANVGTVSARVSPDNRGSDSISGGEVTNASPWVVTLPAGTSVLDTDRIVYLGQTFEVLRSSTPRSYEACVRVECVEVS